MNKLSIVIPVFNKWNFTKSCLDDLSILTASTPEIIVVDNGSTDITSTGINQYNSVKYIRNEKNLGFAGACNIGFAAATGNMVMFLNNDIRVKYDHGNWTNKIIDTISEHKNSLVGPTGGMVDVKNNFQFMYESHNDRKPINYMSGWCLSAHVDTFNKLKINNYCGPFSEEFGLAYFEDTDLGFRASKLSIEFRLVDIPVVHFGKITSGQINTHKLYSEARKIFITKWSGKGHDIIK